MDVDPEDKNKIYNFLRSYSDVFGTTTSPLGTCVGVKHKIDTGNAVPIKSYNYRHSLREATIIDSEVDKMHDN